MQNALKGMLLSGLVLPGLGQIALKRYKRGIALIMVVFAAVCVIIVTAVGQAFTILENIEAEGRPVDIEALTSAASQAPAADHLIINLAFLTIVISWIISIVDACLIGRKMDRSDKV